MRTGPCRSYHERACRPEALSSSPVDVVREKPTFPRGENGYKGLPMTEKGGRWAAVRSALQFVTLLQRCTLETESTSHMMTGVDNTFELMVSTFGRNSAPSLVLCSLVSDALDLPQTTRLDFLRTRGWKTAATYSRTLFVAYGVRPQEISLQLPNHRLYIRPPVQEYLAGIDAKWEERLTRWALGV